MSEYITVQLISVPPLLAHALHHEGGAKFFVDRYPVVGLALQHQLEDGEVIGQRVVPLVIESVSNNVEPLDDVLTRRGDRGLEVLPVGVDVQEDILDEVRIGFLPEGHSDQSVDFKGTRRSDNPAL